MLLDQREQVLANKVSRRVPCSNMVLLPPPPSLSLPSQVSRGDSAGEDALATIDMKLDALESQLRVRECEHVQCTCELVFAAIYIYRITDI